MHALLSQEALEEAELVIQSAFEGLEEPPLGSLSDRAERVRWFLSPHEAWEYGNGRTDPATNTSFTPKTYRVPSVSSQLNREASVVEDWHRDQVMDIRTGSVISRNKSFKLYLKEVETGEESPCGLTVVSRVTISRSIDDLDQLPISPQAPPRPLYASCADLCEDRKTYKKGKRRRVYITKKLKSIFKIK